MRIDIDNALSGCKDFEEFLARMRAEGYEVRRRVNLLVDIQAKIQAGKGRSSGKEI